MIQFLFWVLPLVYLGANIYLYCRTLQLMGAMPVWVKVAVSVFFWFSVSGLFAAIGLRNSNLPHWVLKIMYIGGSVWLVFMLYSVLLLIVADICSLFLPAMKPSLLYVLPLACVILLYGYVNYRHPKVEEIEIVLDKDSSADEVKVVAVSDIHIGFGTGPAALHRYVELINSYDPDVILIAGDLIDNDMKPVRAEAFDKELDALKASQGVYMVPGNHEYISGIDECLCYLQERNIMVLRDSIAGLPGGIQLLGRDDITNSERKSLTELMQQVDQTRPVIVMDHQPYGLAEADSAGVDIQISGHTHRGQVWPLNYITDLIFEQSHGYRKWTHAHVWVSCGLSLWGPPFRIGTHSDMLVMKIRFRNSAQSQDLGL